MELMGFPETSETIRFIRMFDRFFDCLNVSNLTEGRKSLHSMHPSYRPCHTVKAYILFLVIVTCTTTSVLLVSQVPTSNHTLSIILYP